MILPSAYTSYCQSIIQRCRKFISYGFWTGLTDIRLSRWINNFQDDSDKYFACRILDNLIYRSDVHFKAYLREMVYTSLPAILNQNYGIKENGKKLHDKLIANDNEYKLRFVLSKGPNDHLSKSCFNVARQLDKNLRINKGIILNPSDLLTSFDPDCKYVICDDFSGTGNQFIKNIEDNGERYISLIHDNKNIIFHPMVIHEDSIKKINQVYPKIIFGYIEKLTQVNNVFSIENGIFEDGENNIEDIKNHYLKMIDQYKITGVDNFGFCSQGLILAFEDAAPDNSIPLIWYSGERFSPLFNRS
ncbi:MULTISPECIES: phosphoribosyltransferase-like protein [Leptospira]|uniref:phosphoribosyltransferase-like protein n=1 Tax=Leptospira TaxID=171 RepID=UPI000773DA64|nr:MULTISPECIES: hypothetical protein [Leptospira]